MRWIGLTGLAALLVAGVACERGEDSWGRISLEVEEAPCSCPGMIDIQLTHDAMVVAGNTIIKIEDGQIDELLVDRNEKTIIPLYNLLAKVREIETRADMAESFVVVQVVDPVPPESVELLKSTLDRSGYTYHIRVHHG